MREVTAPIRATNMSDCVPRDRPWVPRNVPTPEQHFARDQRGDEPLYEVADPVVRVLRQSQEPLEPEAQRHARVRVGPAENLRERVERDEHVEQGRERK